MKDVEEAGPGGRAKGGTGACRALPLQLNSAGLEKIDIQAYISRGLLCVGLYIAHFV